MISMAFSMATISSARSFWRASKSVVFFAHVALRSSRYFWSASRAAVVSDVGLRLGLRLELRRLHFGLLVPLRGGLRNLRVKILHQDLEGLQ
jgi:hypothetical protein